MKGFEGIYRGKRRDNGEWVHGYYIGDCGDGCHEICDINAALAPRIEVDPETVGVSIGVRDMYGRAIYTGDLIRSSKAVMLSGVTFRVDYNADIASFMARAVGESERVRWTPCLNYGTMKTYEVIGNIYDNPAEAGEYEQICIGGI